ncbi:MAG: hypothetical protein IPI64_09995 [Chloracidobacterium sp.]|nr:hypothetical protein [Chloracidobacterium sp.]
MKKLLLITLLFIVSTVASGQSRTLTEAEFFEIRAKSCEKTKAVAHIQTETIEKFEMESKSPYYVYVSIRRYLPTDRVWTTASAQKGGSKTAEPFEEIRIGNTSYTRKGTAAWKVQELGFSGLYLCSLPKSRDIGQGSGIGSGNSGGNRSRTTIENQYMFVGQEKIGAKTANLYVRVEKSTVTDPDFPSVTTKVAQYWISTDGFLLETTSTTRYSNARHVEREVREYDYDQKDLKIEAPAIK